MEQQSPYLRVQQSWLAANERTILVSIANSLPRRIKPDHLTVLGVAGALLCAIGFAASAGSPQFLWLVIAGLLLNWAGDSLDGTLARIRGIERPRYGFFVDHTSDIFSQTLIFMGLAASPYVRFDTGCLLLMSYWLAAMYTFIRTISVKVFQISYFGIGPTEIRLGLIAYAISLLTVGPLPFATRIGVLSLMDLLAMPIFAVVILSFVIMTLAEAQRLRALEVSPGVPHSGNTPHPGNTPRPANTAQSGNTPRPASTARQPDGALPPAVGLALDATAP